MPSNWRSLAEKWGRGEEQRKDVVIEAVLEGQITELVAYLNETDAEDSGKEDTKTISKDEVESECCRYAYEYLQDGNAEKAVQLLSAVKDPVAVSDWLKEAMLKSFDRPVRETAANHLRSINELTDEDESTLEKLWMLSELYVGESFKAALNQCSAKKRGAQKIADAMDSILPKSALASDLFGICLKPGEESLWGSALNEKNEPGGSNAKKRKDNLPYMKVTGDWVQSIPTSGIIAEGETLSGKSVAKAENAVQKWATAFQFHLSHHMVEEVLKMVESVPLELITKSILRVFDGDSEVLSFGVDALNADLSSASPLIRHLLEMHLLSRGLWTTTEYSSVEAFLSSSAQSGLLLGTTDLPFDLIPLFRGLSTAKVVINYCSRNGLSHLLQLYLENHNIPSDQESTSSLLQSAEGCHWAQWLILSRAPNQDFASIVENAKAVLPLGTKIDSLEDLAEHGSKFMLLSALSHFPGSLRDAITSDDQKDFHSSSHAETQAIEGLVQSALPGCSIGTLNRCLDQFPTVKDAFKELIKPKDCCGKVSKANYFKWRDDIFGADNIGLLDLVPNKDTTDFAALLRMCSGGLECDASREDRMQDAGSWEQEVVVNMHEWLEMVTSMDGGTGIYLGICYHLMSGHPMAALHWFLTTKEDQAGESMDLETLENKSLCLPSHDLLQLGNLARLVALQNWQSPSVVSACMVLACACGLNVAPLKVDVTALQKLDSMECMKGTLAENFFREVHSGEQGGTASKEVLAALEDACSMEPSVTTNNDKPLMSQGGEGGLEASDSLSLEKLESNQVIMMDWSLVHAFAAVHGLKPSNKLLEQLAKCDDWILFLAEAGVHEYSREEVVEIAQTKFSDPCLGHHVCLILASHAQTEVKEGEDGSMKGAMDIPESPKSQELFEILIEAEKTGLPGQALLKWACQLNWQILAVVAACCPDAPLLSCLVAWLDIFACSDKHALSAEADPEGSITVTEKLAWHAHNFCKQGRFGDLLEAFLIFPVLQGKSTSHFFNGLSMFVQHMLPSAELHFKAFQEALTKNDAHDPQGAKSGDASTPSVRSTLGSSPSLRDMRALDPGVEAELMERVYQTSALSVLHALPSAYEKEKLLEMLAALDNTEGCTWPSGLRAIKLAYKLLGSKADEYVVWQGSGASARPLIRNAEEVLATLEQERKWVEARQWGQANDVDPHEITRREAEALVQEWVNLGLWDDLHEVLWEEVHEMFKEHQFPGILAGVFFLRQAVNLNKKISKEEVQDLVVRAISWLKGDIVSVPEDSASKLTAGLRRALFLYGGDPQHLAKIMPQKESVGGKYSRSPAVQMILKAVPLRSCAPEKQPVMHNRNQVYAPVSKPPDLTVAEEQGLEEGAELCQKLSDRPSEEHLDRTIKVLLELGEFDDARKLGSELQIQPINVFLVETAMSIINTCGASGWSGSSVEGIVMSIILNFLRGRNYIAPGPAPGPQEVLDAVAKACQENTGQSVCRRAALTYKASTILGISCEDLAELGPYKMLEMLLGKGEEALDVARRLGAAFELTPRATARMLAQILLKDVVRSPEKVSDGTSEDLSRQSRCEELMANAVICNDWIEVGNALMQLLLERHSALPSEVEADILAMAHQCYERCEYAEGLDVLLDLAGSRIEEYASGQMYEALVKLITGLGKYENMQEPLDLLVKHNQLEHLLNAAGERGRTSAALQSAILCSAHRHKLGDSESLAIVHEYFYMHTEIAKGLKNQAIENLQKFASQNYPARDPSLLQVMDMLIKATEEFSSMECSLAAAHCSALLALVAQQASFPDRHWVCLTDSASRDLLPLLPDFSQALVVGRAYQFNTPQDWVLTLWEHIVALSRGSGMFGASVESLLLSVQAFSKSMLTEVVIGDSLELVADMFLFNQSVPVSYDKTGAPIDKEMLAKCFVQLLRSIPDYAQRLALCEKVGEQGVQSIHQECLDVLDVVEIPSGQASNQS